MRLTKLAGILAVSTKRAFRPAPAPPDAPLPERSKRTTAAASGAAALASFLGDAPGDCAPAALLHALCFEPTVDLLSDPAVPVPVAGLVVSDQQWELAEPVAIGSAVTVDVQLASIVRDSSSTSLFVRARIRCADRPVYREVTVYVARKAGGEAYEVGRTPRIEVLDHRRAYGTNASGRLDIGQNAAVSSRVFRVADSRRWARITGDANPIHTSSLAAKAFGYRKAVLHGAAVDAWMAHEAGLDGAAPCSGGTHFRAPALLPAHCELVRLGAEDFAVVDRDSGRDLVHARLTGVPDGRGSERGLVLPRDDGRPSSTFLGRGMAAAAAVRHPRARAVIEDAKPWRRMYRTAMAELSAWDAPGRGSSGACDGLAFLHENLRFADGRRACEARIVTPARRGDVIDGTGRAVRELRVPIGGRDLAGDELVAELRRWQEDGRIRPGAVDAIADVVADPSHLDLSGWTFACLGAGAELSPAAHLLAWGADVAAVARSPLPELARRAPQSAGRLHLPPQPLDVAADPETSAGWIASLPGRIAVVDTLYAPGARFLLAEAGADVLERLVCQARPETALAWYGSPSDAYALDVPVRRDFGKGGAARALSAYARVRRIHPSRRGGVYQGLIDVQGPNYAVAKRIGRWRATVERETGRTVSYNIGPMSMTRSVLDARVLRAAYGGLARLGMPALPANASAALMAALLAWDLKHPEAGRSPGFLTDKAIDCGLFACPYEPNGLMGFAAVLGADRAVRD